jgi:hypothetical protein
MKESYPCVAGLDGITERWAGRSVFILAPNLYLIGVRIPFERHDQTSTSTLVELAEHRRPRSAWRVARVLAYYHHGKVNDTIRTIASTVDHVWFRPMRSARLRGSGRS